MSKSNEANKAYYERNKEVRKASILKRQRDIRETITNRKFEKGCCVCGYNRSARSLHFHHKDESNKEHDVSRMLSQGRSLKSILQELEKCVILCSNCHGELHDGFITLG